MYRHHEAFLAKENASHGKKILFSVPGSIIIKTNVCEVTGRSIVVHPDCVLIKASMEVTDILRGLEFCSVWSLYTSWKA